MILDLKKRLTRDIAKFESARNSPDSLVYYEPGDSQVVASTSVSLNIGNHYFDQTTGARHPVPEKIKISSGDFVVVESLQRFKVPRNVMGFVSGKGRAMFQGVMVAPGKIDPSFYGHLRIYMFNAGKYEVELDPGNTIASVIFHNTETPYVGLEVGEGFPALPPKPGFFRKTKLLLQGVPRWVWVAIGGLIAGVYFVISNIDKWLLWVQN